MKTVYAREMRDLDRRTMDEFGTPGEILMERAGRGVADIAINVFKAHEGSSVLLIAGTGNNGGDVFAAATFLSGTDLDVEVWICGSQEKIKGDARVHLKKMIRAGVIPVEVRSGNDLFPVFPPDLIVDGLLGTGAKGAPRGFMTELIDWICGQKQNSFIVSIDIPSGVDADTGVAEGTAVQADLTATMGLPKIGLICEAALPYVGNLEVIDIGIPQQYTKSVEGCADAEYIDGTDLRMPPRDRVAHKGSYGHVLLIGGSCGYTGSIAMAARAALRSGSGLVSVLTPEAAYPIVAQAAGPEVMVHATSLPFSALRGEDNPLPGLLKKCNVVCVGPGMGRSDDTRRFIEELLKTCPVPLVLDADALCISPEKMQEAKGPVVITPHPGEFERLFGQPVHDRWTQARDAAQQTGATVILKGAGTVIAVPNKKIAVNLTGNPGMATGGSGDVLAGMVASFIGQGKTPRDAAATAVYLHGLAGDLAAERMTQESLIATDLIDNLPDAFLALKRRR